MKYPQATATGVALLLLSGCASQTATASFPKTSVPVLLGPVDRIGGGEPLATVGEEWFAGSAIGFHSVSTTQSGNTQTTKVKTEERGPEYLAEKLRLEYDSPPNWDVRVTELDAHGEAALLGDVRSTRVHVRGNVVAVKKGSK